MPSPCSPTCFSPTWPTSTRRSLGLSLLYLFLSLLITLGSPVPPGRQGAPQQLEPPPLSANTGSGWDPRGLAGCAVSALGPEQRPQHLLSKVFDLLPERQLPPSHQLRPGPSSSPQASCLRFRIREAHPTPTSPAQAYSRAGAPYHTQDSLSLKERLHPPNHLPET